MPEKHPWREFDSIGEEEQFSSEFCAHIGYIAIRRIRLKAKLHSLETQLLGGNRHKNPDAGLKLLSNYSTKHPITASIKKRGWPDWFFEQYVNLKALAEEAATRADLIVDGYWIKLEADRLTLAPDYRIQHQRWHRDPLDAPPPAYQETSADLSTLPNYSLDDLNDLQNVLRLITKELSTLSMEVRRAHDFVHAFQHQSKQDSIR